MFYFALLTVAFKTSDMCDHALKLDCCSKITSNQKSYNDNKNRYLLTSYFELDDDKKYYVSNGWSVYRNEITHYWTIEQCSSQLKAYTEYEAECPDEIPQEALWKYEGAWGSSLPDASQIFYFMCNA